MFLPLNNALLPCPSTILSLVEYWLRWESAHLVLLDECERHILRLGVSRLPLRPLSLRVCSGEPCRDMTKEREELNHELPGNHSLRNGVECSMIRLQILIAFFFRIDSVHDLQYRRAKRAVEGNTVLSTDLVCRIG